MFTLGGEKSLGKKFFIFRFDLDRTSTSNKDRLYAPSVGNIFVTAVKKKLVIYESPVPVSLGKCLATLVLIFTAQLTQKLARIPTHCNV